VKLKKDTLKLHKFETGLLNCAKSYLVKLSKSVRAAASIKDPTNHAYSSGKYSLQCLCQLFIAHPNFNFSNHIVQVRVDIYFINVFVAKLGTAATGKFLSGKRN
jgi:hypothetical protein